MQTTHQHPVAICNICHQPISIPCTGAPGQIMGRAQQAAQEHLAQHPPRERARFVLSTLESAPLAIRLQALKEAYGPLDDQDRRGVYSVDEALGSAAMYRLWLDAGCCSGPHCRGRNE
jgi:hypothetical protein